MESDVVDVLARQYDKAVRDRIRFFFPWAHKHFIDDVSQETWLRLLRLGDKNRIEDPLHYIAKMARNVGMEWLDRAVYRQPHYPIEPTDELHSIGHIDDVETIALPMAKIIRVQEALSKLPPRQRRVITLHFDDGLTYKQIAQREGWTYRKVLRELSRAYAALRMSLK